MDKNGLIAEIEMGESFETPRDWDNLGQMYVKSRGCIGVDETNLDEEEVLILMFDALGESPEDIVGYISQNGYDVSERAVNSVLNRLSKEIAVCYPVYRYEHGSVSYDTFTRCRWDSGLVGIMYATKEKIKECYGVKRMSKSVIEKASKNLFGELKTYTEWANGEVYTVSVYDSKLDYINKNCSERVGGYYMSDYEDLEWLSGDFGLVDPVEVSESSLADLMAA